MKLLVLLALAAITEPEADKLFQAQDWPRVAEAYTQLTKQDPSRGSHWYRLGVARQSLGQPQPALDAFGKARDLLYKPAGLYIRAAILLSRMNHQPQALEWLRALLDTGFAPASLARVPALAELLESEGYRKLVEPYRQPCSRPEFRALDFWVGDFEVRTPDGEVSGRNRIEKILGGCVLLENWSSKGGGEGKSFSWFDPELKKWRQLFIGSNGHSHEYTGEAREGGVHFLHDRRHPDGSRQMFRMSFTPQDHGKVRQFIEESWDGGKSWALWFDGLYVPVKPD